eukprot:m.57927 g.57927  ORF g.57927 m.57927 type:complete len:530 (-) comp7841_c0_seq4:80-1669(-)
MEENDGDGILSLEDETFASFRMVFLLSIMSVSILVAYAIEKYKIHYLPESVAIILIGVLASSILRFVNEDLEPLETFDTTSFFLFILPPIIFESGYSLHRRNFFQHFSAILTFAFFGTLLSALVVGFGVYWLGKQGLVFELSSTESFAFGSLISAVDPVATLAIFQALDVDKTLFMLVFGESVLNDAVSIVLTRTILQLGHERISWAIIGTITKEFLLASVGSAIIGVIFGFLGALILKFTHLRKSPPMELATLVVFAYLPYVLSESLDLSGIMAILFAGMTHAHYTQFNLSQESRAAAKHSFRGVAFMAETAAFLYLGFSVASFDHILDIRLIVASLSLCMLGRALNIFPLAYWINSGRASPEKSITFRMQIVMWFSGLRGAIAFALVSDLEGSDFSEGTQKVLMSTTLVIILFTIIVFGGSTWPMLNWLRPKNKQKTIDVDKTVTTEMGKRSVISPQGLSSEPLLPTQLASFHSASERVVESVLPNWLEKMDASLFQPLFRNENVEYENEDDDEDEIVNKPCNDHKD